MGRKVHALTVLIKLTKHTRFTEYHQHTPLSRQTRDIFDDKPSEEMVWKFATSNFAACTYSIYNMFQYYPIKVSSKF